MRARAIVGVALVLAGCNQKAPPSENQASATEKVSAETNVGNGNIGSSNAAAAPGNARALPPANAAFRFVGTWATNAANCASKPWRFTKDELTATGGPKCSFYKVSIVPGGYDIAAQCPAKEPVHTDLIKLRFAESAQAMLVESNAISPMGLVYCGE